MSKVLFLINSLMVGGAEHVLVDVANRMADDGFDVTVQTIFDSGEYRNALTKKLKYRKGVCFVSGKLHTLVYRFLCLLPSSVLYKLLIKGHFDYEIAFLEGLPTKVIAGCKEKNVHKTAWVHIDLLNYYGIEHVYGTQKKNSECYRAYDQILCVSNDVKDAFIKRFGNFRNILVQYNPLEKASIIAKSKEEPAVAVKRGTTFKIVALGRLVDQKGFDLLIEAIHMSRDKLSKKIEVYIIGGGPDELLLKSLIKKYHLEDTVFLCGKQTNPYSIMSRCDMQLISSRAEGFSLALCEGHILGLPVVSTKCAGPVEIISSSNAGILVEITAEDISRGLIQMVNDDKTYSLYKENAIKWSNKYNPNDIYSEIEARFR